MVTSSPAVTPTVHPPSLALQPLGYVYLLDIKAETADPRPDEIARLQSTLDHLANEKSVGAL